MVALVGIMQALQSVRVSVVFLVAVLYHVACLSILYASMTFKASVAFFLNQDSTKINSLLFWLIQNLQLAHTGCLYVKEKE